VQSVFDRHFSPAFSGNKHYTVDLERIPSAMSSNILGQHMGKQSWAAEVIQDKLARFSVALLAAIMVLVVVPGSAMSMDVKENVSGFAEFAKKGGAMEVNPSCFVTSCGKQTKECFVEDGRCLKGALCLSRCRGDPDCATGCFAEFGCKRLDAWLNCTVEKEKCVSTPSQLINNSAWFETNIPKKLKNFDASTMQGTWYKTRGYNKKYDCYLCQPNRFDYQPGSKTLLADIQLRLPKAKSSNFWQNNIQERLLISEEGEQSTFKASGEIFGLSFEEEWYVVAADSDYILMAYKGFNLQDKYDGTFVYARTPNLPADVEAKAKEAAEANGYSWSQFCVVDNTCPPQPQVSEAPVAIGLEDVPDLIEWFAPGTIPKSEFSGRYN